MSKKYLSIEEAAVKVGVSTSQLNRMREQGSIRAFADRGTWKFKEEDVEKLARNRQADSDPDVPLRALDWAQEDSATDMVFMDEDPLGSQPTIIRKGGDDDSGSDSDVRLIFDDSMNVSAVKLPPEEEDSDSDVKLAGATPASPDAQSDSDVKLINEDMPTDGGGSDSDVRLVSSDSSGEVKLASGPGSAVQPSVLGGSDKYPGDDDGSTISLTPAEEGSSILEDDSGISLAEGSGIALAGDSGISLEQPNDSGISLTEESSIVLAEDSGISLAPEGPSSIKGGKKKKGKSPADSDDLTGTIPLMDVPLAGEDEDILDTQMEVPLLDDSSDDAVGGRGDSTSVITLDEDEDEYAITGDSSRPAAVEDTGEEEILGDDDEVADEIIGEDDELAEDVFSEDEDFAEEVESGESVSELPVTRGVAAPVEQDWGTPTFAGLALSALLMIACGTVMFDLVRNMWHMDVAQQNPVSSALLDMFKGL